MFIDRLLNQGNAPLLEQMVKFTQARHRLIAENNANVSTPNYRTKDLSIDRFQAQLRQRVQMRRESSSSVTFDDVSAQIDTPNSNVLFHDRNNRSMEQIQSDMAQNALLHNLMTELLRKQFASVQDALKERVT